MKSAPARSIDWSRIVFDLEALGMTQREIGLACDKSPDGDGAKVWVNKLKNIPRTQPKFHEGALLLGLWAERMAQPVDAVPRDSMPVPYVAGKVPAPPLVDAVGVMASVKES